MERNGRLFKYFWSASSHSLCHKNLVFLWRSQKNGRHLLEDLLIKWFSAAAIPICFYTSFAFFGLSTSLITTIYFGFASISHWVTKCPWNFPELTSKVQLAAFILSLCYFKISTTSTRSFKWSLFFAFNHYVIDVGVYGTSHQMPEHLGDCSLVYGSSIL